ncbi:MAG: hypothetical protein P4L71_07285 [Acetobacteraceae bacterium]|nr:hypothetical protein [Acetobacteraceae bacterium]
MDRDQSSQSLDDSEALSDPSRQSGAGVQTVNATDFKARCLQILDRLSARELSRVTITKRGRIVAVLSPPVDLADAVRALHGCMRGSVTYPPEIDLTAPILDEPLMADHSILHR